MRVCTLVLHGYEWDVLLSIPYMVENKFLEIFWFFKGWATAALLLQQAGILPSSLQPYSQIKSDYMGERHSQRI